MKFFSVLIEIFLTFLVMNIFTDFYAIFLIMTHHYFLMLATLSTNRKQETVIPI